MATGFNDDLDSVMKIIIALLFIVLSFTSANAAWTINSVENPRTINGVYYPDGVNGVADGYAETEDDAYAETNQNDDAYLYAGGQAQSFTSGGGRVSKVTFYLKKTGSPTGNAYAKIYAHSGTYGTSSIPTGSALGTSGALDVSTLDTSYANIDLTFTGANRVILTDGTYYVVTLEFAGGDADNRVNIGQDTTSSSHDGNDAYTDDPWTPEADNDLCFYVYVIR